MSRARSAGFWTLAALVLVATAGFLVNAVLLNPPVDFLVYRAAAERLLTGGEIYDGYLHARLLPDEGMPFTYTPFAAFLMIATLLGPWPLVYAAWTAGGFSVVAWTINRMMPVGIARRPVFLAVAMVAAIATSIVIHHSIYGQVNLFLMALVLADVLRRPDSRSARLLPPGSLVGVAAAVKLTPALFVVYFLLTRQWRMAAWSVAGGAVTTLGAFAVAPSLSWHFWSEVVWDLENRVDFTHQMFATSGNNSIRGFFAAAAPSAGIVPLMVCVAVAVAGLWAASSVYRRGGRLEAVIIVGLLAPMLSPISWIHHWVYLLPAGVLLGVRAWGRSAPMIGVVSAWGIVVASPTAAEGLLTTGSLGGALVGWPLREGLLLVSLCAIIALTATASWREEPGAPVWSRR